MAQLLLLATPPPAAPPSHCRLALLTPPGTGRFRIKTIKRDSVARFFIPLFLVRNYLCAPNEQDHKVSQNFIFCEDTVFAKTCVCVVVDNEYFVSACSR